MSAWRRIALEHVPSCKQIIEEAGNFVSMWTSFLIEVTDRHADSTSVHQIHRFAFLCLKDKINFKLSEGALLFYDTLLRIPAEDVQFLLMYYSPAELNFLRKTFSEQFPPNAHF